MKGQNPLAQNSSNVLIILTHKTTPNFIKRLKWTESLWKSFHENNEMVVIVDTTDTVKVRQTLFEKGLKTIGLQRDAVLFEAPKSTERENIRGRGYDMVFHFMRHHEYDYYWYIENDVKYDEEALRLLWEGHSRNSDDLICWEIGDRDRDWWAWEESTDEWDYGKEYSTGCLVMLARMSSKFSKVINAYLTIGSSSYVEILMPSVAKRHGLPMSHWKDDLIGLLEPGPEINGSNVNLVENDKGDCRRPASKTFCGGRFWHPSVLALRERRGTYGAELSQV